MQLISKWFTRHIGRDVDTSKYKGIPAKRSQNLGATFFKPLFILQEWKIFSALVKLEGTTFAIYFSVVEWTLCSFFRPLSNFPSSSFSSHTTSSLLPLTSSRFSFFLLLPIFFSSYFLFLPLTSSRSSYYFSSYFPLFIIFLFHFCLLFLLLLVILFSSYSSLFLSFLIDSPSLFLVLFEVNFKVCYLCQLRGSGDGFTSYYTSHVITHEGSWRKNLR